MFQKVSGSQNITDKKGENQYSPSKIFGLAVLKSFVVESFSVSLISDIEIFYASEGYVTLSRQKFFVS